MQQSCDLPLCPADFKTSQSAVIERLEARIAPATLIVTTLTDAGDGSLRDAITKANAAAGEDTIILKTGLHGIVNLASPLPDITDSLTIDGGTKVKLTIDAHNLFRPFAIPFSSLAWLAMMMVLSIVTVPPASSIAIAPPPPDA
ncbi:MAG: hypothetical protein QOD99_374, partial [Chthoniobacter sp.]|nr:hypothetical protein [Chthoniobacter sp.]